MNITAATEFYTKKRLKWQILYHVYFTIIWKKQKKEITSRLYLIAYKYIKGFNSMVLVKRTNMCLLYCLLFEEKLVSFQNLNSKTMISNTQTSTSLDIARGLESLFPRVEHLPPLPPHCMAQNVLNHGRSLNSSL